MLLTSPKNELHVQLKREMRFNIVRKLAEKRNLTIFVSIVQARYICAYHSLITSY